MAMMRSKYYYRAVRAFTVARERRYEEGEIVEDARASDWAKAGLVEFVHEVEPAADEETSTGAAGDGLASMSRLELYQLAKAAGIVGRSAMSKAELIEALSA